jgi:hypothetical protein
MPSELRVCIICGYTHAASIWYYKASADGVRIYVCGEKLENVIDMPQWKLLPADHDEGKA